MESGSSGPTRPVGRGRKAQAAVRAATLAELLDRGYAELTVEGVAQRAGVHKTTVYRRWKDRASLVVDALAEHFAADIPTPDTGAIETDLRALARALAQSMTGPVGRAVQTAMYSDAGRLPEIAEARRRVFADRFRRAEPVITRAIERGELPAETDPVELLKTLAAPIYFRLLVSADPIEEATADQAVRITLAAARAGALVQGSAVAVKAAGADADQP
ncbi:TetR/AcrR family transcriptional regulator [Streptomyces xantholiticus]|uniref:TetR/AcrR family transcriptional regulator n=1 Tax=Streptomyces xantholiticus TaxID=68285 RepID=UPI00167C2841|nr:TetR/AcrR family transcriptional regulator [Streptomyces xantholiticus]GGW67594.1 putative transcriptional regulator, TetR family protein [Streptomyces xantholiticus]